jgi:hypothetical protein
MVAFSEDHPAIALLVCLLALLCLVIGAQTLLTGVDHTIWPDRPPVTAPYGTTTCELGVTCPEDRNAAP